MRSNKSVAGGDAIRGGGTVVESVRDGVLAARSIDRYLQNSQSKIKTIVKEVK